MLNETFELTGGQAKGLPPCREEYFTDSAQVQAGAAYWKLPVLSAAHLPPWTL